MTVLHILRTTGVYIGQVRGFGCRRWRTVTGNCRTPESALARAVMAMRKREDKRARALYVPTGENGSWYGPSLAMEAKRE